MTPSIITLRYAARALACATLLLTGLSSARAAASATPLQEYSLKAALLFNLAKYTDWPARAFSNPDDPIVIGVLGEDPFGEILDRIVEGRLVNGRPILIQRSSGLAPLQGAHLVFVSASQPRAPQDCAALERAGILTVGDSSFTAPHTAVHFAIEADRIIFSVDLSRTLGSGATISSKLLKLAKNVKRPEDPRRG
jgi:hypothetical protein